MKEIHFLNHCINQDWMSDEEKDFRLHAPDFMRTILEKSSLVGSDEVVRVKFYEQGVGSIVAEISLADNKKFVFKTGFGPRRMTGEILTLKKWNESGITTPTVYEEGELDGYPYFIMEHFSQGTLDDKLKDGSTDIETVGTYMGTVLYEIENVIGNGFGIPTKNVDGVLIGEYKSFKEYLQGEFNNDHQLELMSRYMDTVDWKSMLPSHINKLTRYFTTDQSVVGCFDFDPRHFFATDTPVIFDPDSALVPKYFSVMYYISPEKNVTPLNEALRKVVVARYKELIGEIDKDILHSVLWLLVYRKCAKLLTLPSERRIERATHMLSMIADTKLLNDHIKKYF